MYAQRDPRFSSVPLGTSGGATIGSRGCLITAAARMHSLDPGTFNRWMCRNGGFVSGNHAVFTKLGEKSGLSCEVVDCSHIAAPMDKVQKVLDSDGYVLAKIDFYPGGGVQEHWVGILKLTGDDALIHDPWLENGGPYWLMPRYGHYTWNGPGRAIFRLALYTKPSAIKGRKFSATGDPKIVQGKLSSISRSPVERVKGVVRGLRRRVARTGEIDLLFDL